MISVWSDTYKPRKYESVKGDMQTDVLIIGGGMAGVLCAYMLQQAGVDYILVEADKIGCGITKNTTAKITSQHGLIYDNLIRKFGLEKAQMYLRSNEVALARYRKLCADIDCGFEQKDAFGYALEDKGKIERELMALDKLGFQAEFVEDLPLPFYVAGAVKFSAQGQFNPLKFITALAADLNIFEYSTVRELVATTAILDQGRIKSKKIIVATHFPFLNKHGSYFLKMYQHRSYVIALENASNINGMYLDEAQNGMSFRNYEDLLFIGGGDHRTGKKSEGWKELRDYAKRYYPTAPEKYYWATQDCMTLDSVPYIGQYSANTPDLYVATGFNKWGMTSSMVSAMILADMIQGKENPYAAVFSPSRTMVRAQLLLNASTAAVTLLTPTTKRCPHMGCALKWNEHEKSWDCPCHGSRFTEDGSLIDNPATGDLKQKS